MVHRDIKPSNLMLARQGNRAAIKVLDFGLAKVRSEGAVDGGLTHEGQMLGTPAYIAPEQIRNARGADIRADVYSLGCTLYYLLTGEPPFQGTCLYDILQAHHSMEAMPLNLKRPEVPVELAALVAKMMAKEPERRFQEPKEVAQALTPFFKKGESAFKSPEVDVSRAGRLGSVRPVPEVVPTPIEPAAKGAGPVAQPHGMASPSASQPEWELLIDQREAERAREGMSAIGPTSRPRWLWPSVAVGVLLLALFVAWAVVVMTKTSNGIIELADLPKEDSSPRSPPDAVDERDASGGAVEPPATRPVVQRETPPGTIGAEDTGRAGRSEPTKDPGASPSPADHARTARPDLAPASTLTRSAPLAQLFFNDSNLSVCVFDKSDARMWRVENHTLIAMNPDGRGSGARGRGRLLTARSFKEFRFRFEYQSSPDFSFGAAWWTLPGEIPPVFRPATSALGLGVNRGGGRFHSKGKRSELKGGDGWHLVEIEARDRLIRISVNGIETNRRVLSEKPKEPTALKNPLPAGPFPRAGVDHRSGCVGFEIDRGIGRFRNIVIEELPPSTVIEAAASKPEIEVEEDLDEETAVKTAGRPTSRASAPNGPRETITNSIGMKLALIPAGDFMMGSPEGEGGSEEHPQHRVRITRPFYLGVCEVTQSEYEAVVGQNPSHFPSKGGQHPVENVSWLDAVRFCNELSEKEGIKPLYEIVGEVVQVLDGSGPGYRLPTEAEWEYACRAGTTTRFSFGNNNTSLGEYGWYGGNSDRRTHPVGEKKPNAFGLCDMHGNVWEWCRDGYDAEYYQRSPVVDPPGPLQAAQRVVRGGCWVDIPRHLRSADRLRPAPGLRFSVVGFRLARVPSSR
jgi:formylglycine-generating enzyme required for sulfatase activity